MEKEELLEEFYSRDSQFIKTEATPVEQWHSPFRSRVPAIINKTWQILLLLLAVFLIGFTAGIVASKSLSQTSFRHWTLSYCGSISRKLRDSNGRQRRQDLISPSRLKEVKSHKSTKKIPISFIMVRSRSNKNRLGLIYYIVSFLVSLEAHS